MVGKLGDVEVVMQSNSDNRRPGDMIAPSFVPLASFLFTRDDVSEPASFNTIKQSVSETVRAPSTAIAQLAVASTALSQLTLADLVAPTLRTQSPVTMSVAGTMVLVFDEVVVAGNGNITLTDLSSGAIHLIAATDTSQVTFQGSNVWITPRAELAAGHRFDITMAAGVIQDMAGNNYAGLGVGALNFNTPTDLIPGTTAAGTIESLLEYDLWRISLEPDTTYTFGLSKTSIPSLDAYLFLLDSSGHSLAGNNVDGGDHDALITYKIKEGGTYYLLAQGANETTKGNYTVTATALLDKTAPALISHVPADAGTNVALDANIVLTFDETVLAGRGSIYITDRSTNIGFAFDIRDTSQVSLSGSTVTIDPGSDLAAGHRFSVWLSPGVIKDTAENDFQSSDMFYFTTTLTTGESDAIAGSLGTNTVLSTNGMAQTSSIDTPTDQDWWRVNLSAGIGYVFHVSKPTDSALAPSLTMLDSAGNLLAQGLSIGNYGEEDRLLYYTPTNSGTFYLDVQSDYGRSSGIYTISATSLAGITGPVLLRNSATDESAKVVVAANIVLSFSSVMSAGNGNILITDLDNGAVRTIAVTDASQVSFSGRHVTINPTSDLAASHRFEVTMASGVLKDTQGNDFAGLPAGTLDFSTATITTVADTIANNMTTVAVLPTNGAAQTSAVDTPTDQDWWRVSLNVGVTYAFQLDKTSTSGLDPYLRLLNLSGTTLLVNNDEGGDSNAVITYTAPLSGTYYLVAQSANGATTGAYTLTTITDSIAPTLIGRSPFDEAGNVALDTNIVLTFSEAVHAGSGNIFITDLSTGMGYGIDVRNTRQISFSGGSVVINPDGNLTPGHRFDITMAAGVITDMFGNSYAGLASGSLDFITTPAVTGTDTIAATTASAAVLIANGIGVSSSIDSVTDQDWGRISLSAGVTYAFRMNKTATSALNPYLRLLNSSGNLLLANDDGGGNSDALITYQATASGTYYLSAQSANSATTGAYTLKATTLADTTAPTLTSRSPVDESGNVAPGGNLVLTFNEAVRAGSGSITITDLSNGTARFIAVTDTSQVNFSGASVTINPAGDLAAGHRFDVTLAAGVIKDGAGNNYAGLASGALNFTTTAAVTVLDTIAGTMASTAAVVSNGIGGASGIDTAVDQDWWRISLSAGVTYAFRMDKTASSLLNPYLRLLDSAGKQLLVDNDSGGNSNALITYQATASGTYYLSAQSANSATTGTYTLAAATLADTTAPTLIGHDPYDEVAGMALDTNIGLGFNETVRAGSGNIVIADLSDGTARLIAVTDTSQVSFSGSNVTINPASDLAPNHRFEVTLAAGVIKDVAGNNYAGLASGAFNFATMGAVMGTDVIANSISTNAVLAVNGAVQGSSINTGGDQDWWRISLNAGTSYAFRLNKTATSALDPYLRLLDNGGHLLLSNNDGSGNSDALITYTAPANGSYYLSAQSFSSASLGAYTLQATSLGDNAAPLLTGKSPADDSVNVAPGANIVLTFNETVLAGSGSIVINDLTSGSARTIAATDASQVSFSGNSVTINPSSDLAAGHRFDVTLAAGVVKDAGGLGYAGLPAGALNFTTGSTTVPDNDAIAGTALTNAVLTPGVPATGIIDTVADQDWWGIRLSAGSTYTFRLDKLVTSSLDAYLRLLDSAGTQLLANDDGGGNSNALITYPAAASGTYYLSAQSFNNVTSGAYALTAANIDDKTAPTLLSRQPIDGSTDFPASNNIGLVFSETVRAGSGNIVLTDLTSGTARVIAIRDTGQVGFDGSTVVINPGSDLAMDHRFELTLAAGVIKDVAGNDYAGQGAGAFHFSTARGRDTIVETTATTAVLTSDGVAGVSSIDRMADQDWWRISLNAGASYTLRLNKTAGSSLDPILTLFDSTGTYLTVNDEDGGDHNALLVYTPQTSGNFYLAAHGYSTSTGAYALTATSATRAAAMPADAGLAQENNDQVLFAEVQQEQPVTLTGQPFLLAGESGFVAFGQFP